MPGKISQCMANLVALCYADPFFTDLTDPGNPVVSVPIVSRLEPTIDTMVDEALGSIGVGLVVTLRKIRFPESNQPSITAQLFFALSAVSNNLVNETGKNSFDVIERAWQLVHYRQNGISPSGSPGSEFLVDTDAVRPIPPPPKQPFIFWQLLTLSTEIDLSPT